MRRQIGRALLAVVAAMALVVPATAGATALPKIRHVFVIVLENKDYNETFKLYGSSDPYLSQTLPSMGATVPYYFGTGHASADNYIAMVSGQPPTAQTKNDCNPAGASNEIGPTADRYGIAQGAGCWYPSNFHTIADQLTEHGYTWKGYMEDMNGACTGSGLPGGTYALKHNPFPYFASLLTGGQCAANDVPLYPASDTNRDPAASNLALDLREPDTTANYSFITPNECEDGHNDCTNSSAPTESPMQTEDMLHQSDAFLQKFVPMILSSKAYKRDGMLVITTDEADVAPTALFGCCGEPTTDPDGTPPGGEGSSGLYSPGPGGGQVGAVVLSPAITPGTQTNACYNHYSLLHTVEDLFGFPYLGEAAKDASGQPGGVDSFGADVFTNPGGIKGAATPRRRSRLPSAPSVSGTGPTCETSPVFGAVGVSVP